jgi:hypothetical protein
VAPLPRARPPARLDELERLPVGQDLSAHLTGLRAHLSSRMRVGQVRFVETVNQDLPLSRDASTEVI